ncbi:SUMF1/EgtB/PvdO family nonheme iron enzyme [Novosphingobium aquae]|uniref:SUMF1/EgtB/PvdO family nonheme iron enzyme n=1 Tax=Novosphingobium aquae TaxID=3133435 RepID=A0ABU8S792_9SPHN
MIVRLFAAALALVALPAMAKPRVLPAELVWPNGVPGGAEPVKEESNAVDVWNVTTPSYQAFLPPKGKGNGAAMIIAPGGGFRLLSMAKSQKVAEWFVERGVAAFVLKYRLVTRLPGETPEAQRDRLNATMRSEDRGTRAAEDGIQALRLIRARAGQYGIDPQRIGVVGFSAGGHVAGMMALASEPERPNLVGLIYGMPFLTPPPPLPPANLPWPPGTPKEPWLRPAATPAPGALPPHFMVVAQDDTAVGNGFRDYYEALYVAGYRPEAHIYEKGGHGFVLKKQGLTSDYWIDEFYWWIEARGFLKAPAAAKTFTDCKLDCPEMVVIAPGKFRMGADGGEEGRPEGPPHDVAIAKPFALGRFEVTNAQYERFIADTGRVPTKSCRSWDRKSNSVSEGADADFRKPGIGAGDGAPQIPVVCVSWRDAKAYVGWLAKKSGKPYRLPTEAEWEYAARAGSPEDYAWGKDPAAGCGWANTLDRRAIASGMLPAFQEKAGEPAHARCDDAQAGAAPVGSYKPNAFGLYDMTGNVWEWTEDCYAAPYAPDVPTDGSAYQVKGECARRAVRGGSWMTVPFRNRPAWRGRDPEDQVSWIFGMRVARDLDAKGR